MDLFRVKKNKTNEKSDHSRNDNKTISDYNSNIIALDSKMKYFDILLQNIVKHDNEYDKRINSLEVTMHNTSDVLGMMARSNVKEGEAITKRLKNLEDRIHQLEVKNNPQPKLSIEKIPPISFLSK